MSISIETMQQFCTVVEAKSLSQAASQLNVTQPTLSWSMKKLEEKVGATLFVRSKSGMKVTPAGRTFYDRSQDLIRRWQRLTLAIDEEQNLIRGHYSLGVYHTLAAVTLPHFLPNLLETYPDLDLDLYHGRSNELARKVINYELDMALVMRAPQHPDLVVVPLFEDRVQFWWHKDKRTLGEHDLIVCSKTMMKSENLASECYKSGLITHQRFLYITELTLIASLTANISGMGLLPASVAQLHQNLPLIPVPNTPSYANTCSLIWRRDMQSTHASEVIREAIKKGLQQ